MHPHGSPAERQHLVNCPERWAGHERREKFTPREEQGREIVCGLRGDHPGLGRGGITRAAAANAVGRPGGVGSRFGRRVLATAGAAGSLADRLRFGHRQRTSENPTTELAAPPGRSRAMHRDQQQHEVPQAGHGEVENLARSHAHASRGRPAVGRRARNSRCLVEKSYAGTGNSTRSDSPRFLLCGIARQRSLSDPRTLPNLPAWVRRPTVLEGYAAGLSE